MAIYEVNGVSVHVEQWNEHNSEAIVMLHGFTGSTLTWHELVELLPTSKRIVAIDLLGHGKTANDVDEQYYAMSGQLEILHDLFKQLQLESFALIGYSMGGRIALSYAVAYPKQVTALLLESASPGLADDFARQQRILNDEKLAVRIESEGVNSFIDFWENIPLFQSQKSMPINRQQALRIERINQTTKGLAASLRYMGTGKMPALWEYLQKLTMPVTLVVGEIDTKFVNISNQMVQKNNKFKQIIIPKVGHAIHVENPQKFATIVKETIF